MEIIKTIASLQAALYFYKKENKSIGFVPTMGALHEGHISLIKQCTKENPVCVSSIFVNPTQFNDKNDLINYPRTEITDCEMLKEAGCDFVFMPDADEIYPETDTRRFEFGKLENVMEGRFRPGHFNGVAQVVSKLFDIVQPDKAYFGEKDFQQLAIIREMVNMLDTKIEIIGCPIVRETDGLAMSSRNRRLTLNQRKVAATISQALMKSKKRSSQLSVEDLKTWVVQMIDNEKELKTEYFEIVDGTSLQSIHSWDETSYPVGCIAVFCGNIRLIDNITY